MFVYTMELITYLTKESAVNWNWSESIIINALKKLC